MSQRHPIQNEQTMFITTNILHRESIFLDPAYAHAAVETLYQIQQRLPFFLFGFVIMPNHCHILMRVPEGGSVSKIMFAYKRGVAFNIAKGPIWQKRFHMRITNNPIAALEYIHWNPVKAGICDHPENYPWSSACGKWDVSELIVM